MKLQHLAIIFVIIILPISLVIGEYISTQIDTIYIQTSYNKKLQDSTYDAIRAFQINTVNNKYSSVSDSKIRDIEASVSTFYNSLGTAMGASGYDKDELREYIPAMLYTMYDGYYIYGKYYDYRDEQYQYGLKPYVYYSCRYVIGATDVIINYTLDNNITVYGNVNGKYVTKSGYVINPGLVSQTKRDSYGYAQSVNYDGLTIEREILKENVLTIEDGVEKLEEYEYTYYNNQKIYKNNDKDENGQIWYFLYQNNGKNRLSDEGRVIGQDEVTQLMYAERMTKDSHLYSNSAVEYYISAYEFSTWLKNNLGNISQSNAKDLDGNPISFATNTNIVNNGSNKIFEFGPNNNPLVEGSVFNENRLSVIRYSIESNLATAIANYNVGSSGTYEFQMPVFTDVDWDKVVNNVSVSVFMQGIPIKSKYYNSYCIITNDKNEEVVTEDSIYIVAEKDGVKEAHMPGCKDLIDNASSYNLNIGQKANGYKVIDFERQTVMKTETEERYYYPQSYTRCYNCIVNVSQTYDINKIIQGKLDKYDLKTDSYKDVEIVSGSTVEKIRKAYLTALARERYDLYRSNGSFGLEDIEF